MHNSFWDSCKLEKPKFLVVQVNMTRTRVRTHDGKLHPDVEVPEEQDMSNASAKEDT